MRREEAAGDGAEGAGGDSCDEASPPRPLPASAASVSALSFAAAAALSRGRVVDSLL